jgi:O-antigen/teichoic acid export membrane protein
VNRLKKLIQDSNNNEVLRKGVGFLVIRAFGLLAGYGFTLFISRYYGAAINGYVALSFSIFLIGSLIPRFGFDVNLVKTFSSFPLEEAKRTYQKTVKLSLIVGLLVCLAGLLFRDFFSSVFDISDPRYVILGFISIPIWSLISINAAVLRGVKKIKEFSFLTNAGRFIVALALLLLGFYFLDFKSPEIPIIAHTIGLGLLLVYSFYNVHQVIGKIVPKDSVTTSAYLKESYPLMFSLALVLLLGWTDTVFLGIFATAEDVGVYHVALKLAALVGFSLQSLNSILAPKVAKLFKENRMVEFKQILTLVVKINFFTSALVIVLLVLFRVPILGLFGEEFVVGSTLLILLCVGQFSNAICGPVGVVFQMTGKQKTFQNLVLIAFLINLILNFVLIKPYGYYGAAISSIISMSFWNFAGVYIIWKEYKVILAYIPFLKSNS